ncbi:CHAT domain-containing protein [Lactarius akahatsu]|uniref:CHAT domain-containing protein n=1 Tax=Lactarius akahatsu TaxID=416441 RepID=A0AAD4LE53_9AGAM|nr:CHAT domain-containing protein [Lactarius akahatsu]
MHDILPVVSADIERAYTVLPLFPRPHPLRPRAIAALGTALYCRYLISRHRDDLDALIPLFTEVLLLPLDPAAPYFSQITKIFYKLACCLAFRFDLSRGPEDLEYAIKYYRHLLALPSKAIVELNPLEVLDNLTKLLVFKVQSATEVQPDHADEVVGIFQRLAILDPSSEHVGSIAKSMGIILLARLSQFGPMRFQQTSLYDHCSQAIARLNKSLTLLPSEHLLRPLALICIATVLHHRFTHDKQLRSLEESITYTRTVLNLWPPGHPLRPGCLALLSASLRLRYAFFGKVEDFEESMALFLSALDDEEYANPDAKYQIASQWAACARAGRHPCTALAYQTAVSLMHSSLVLGPTLPIQHRLIRKRWGELAAVPLYYASYYIEVGALERAVETLEQGRGLLWSEMRGLRTSMDRLKLSDGDGAALAERFVAVSEELENIATSAEAPEDSVERPGDADHHTSDAFGRMMEKVHELERKRAEITERIRALPDFGDFLRAVPFEALHTAAACGPIVIINHCRYRCDILIVLHGSSPVHIPTGEDFYSRTIKLKEHLLSTRAKHALESNQYQHALRFVLEELYELVGRPVIEKLHELEIPEQSRVWWCPTSVLCSLPLHAAGPIESDGKRKRYFSDVYVSSYTPTLSALIESRKDITHTPDPPSLLIVAQPDVSLPGVWGEIEVVQKLAQSATTLLGPRATQQSVTKQLSHHRMVHFACHGTLEPDRPFDTAFLLRGGERLSLLDIVRSRLSTAELAVLSVCHAAEWTDAYTPDEALHLTAAMQYCGFRSAVGTLWAMADTDGRDLAEHFYRRVFAEEEQGVSLGERSARALRDAVRKLRRKKGVSLERWVNFVHYGA